MSYVNAAHGHAQRDRSQGLFTFLSNAVSLRKQRAALGTLSDAQLSDIGVTRAEAEAEARRTIWDAPLHWKR